MIDIYPPRNLSRLFGALAAIPATIGREGRAAI
jgi:hypothetical protein